MATWHQLLGTATDIGVGSFFGAWAIGTTAAPGGRTIHPRMGDNWGSFAGGAERIAVSPENLAWVINASRQIFVQNGLSWTTLPGTAQDLGVGYNHMAWVVGTTATSGGFEIFRWSGAAWTLVTGAGAERISVEPNGTPWAVKANGEVIRRDGNAWTSMSTPNKAKDIGVGMNGAAWIIGTTATSGGFEIFEFTGNDTNATSGGWTLRPGGAVSISVSPEGTPWVVNSSNHVYVWA